MRNLEIYIPVKFSCPTVLCPFTSTLNKEINFGNQRIFLLFLSLTQKCIICYTTPATNCSVQKVIMSHTRGRPYLFWCSTHAQCSSIAIQFYIQTTQLLVNRPIQGATKSFNWQISYNCSKISSGQVGKSFCSLKNRKKKVKWTKKKQGKLWYYPDHCTYLPPNVT